MAKYRKKPVVIEAIEYRGNVTDLEPLGAWHKDITVEQPLIGYDLTINTLEGAMVAQPGDWIIKGVKGELYPCKPDIFEATYEPAPSE